MNVAHIIYKFNVGGIEKWLSLLNKKNSSLKNEANRLFFFTQTKEVGHFDKKVIDDNGKIHYHNLKKGFASYSLELYKDLKKNNIDVIHCHLALSCGWILFIAYLARVNVRVAHCHSVVDFDRYKISLFRKAYFFFMKFLINHFANRRIAVSEIAGKSCFGKSNFDIMPCGIDNEVGFQVTKESIGIPGDAFVLFQAGRFVKEKNHFFSLELMQGIGKDFYLVLAGDGSLRHEINQKANALGVSERVKFLGSRNDINELMHGVADICLLPSLAEGFGLVAVEAQAQGVPVIISDNVPDDVIISNICFKIPLSSRSEWVKKLNELVVVRPELEIHKEFVSIFDNIDQLKEVYSS